MTEAPVSDEALIRAERISKIYSHRGSDRVTALDQVSLSVAAGETVGIVGESGSGKSTLARCILRLVRPTSGRVVFDGVDVTDLPERRLRGLRKRVQMVFQDPADALDPRMRVRDTIEEPLLLLTSLDREARRRRVEEMLELVRLTASFGERLPNQLSGGQQQRVGIARALASNPDVLILDEPTSAVDWLVRAEIVKLLRQLRHELGLSFVVISHDLLTVSRLADRVVVMYGGQVVEAADVDTIFTAPTQSYTKALISASLVSWGTSTGRESSSTRRA